MWARARAFPSRVMSCVGYAVSQFTDSDEEEGGNDVSARPLTRNEILTAIGAAGFGRQAPGPMPGGGERFGGGMGGNLPRVDSARSFTSLSTACTEFDE
jgi:hypothetical protein